MTNADRLIQWNRWYDETPEDRRLHIVLWPLVVAGFLNMQLSIAGGFPFGLLVLLTIMAMATIRLPYTLGWSSPPRTARGSKSAGSTGSATSISVTTRCRSISDSGSCPAS